MSDPSAPPADADLDRRAFVERLGALTALGLLTPATLSAGRLPAEAARPGAAVARDRRPADSATRAPAPVGPVPAFPTLPRADAIQATDLSELTLVEAVTLIRRGDVSTLELVDAYLARIDRWEPAYRAFNTVLGEGARAAAARIGAAGRSEAARGRLPLGGAPLALKDNFFTAGVLTTANSLLFETFVPAFDATAWARLRASGGILLGKTQMGPLATTDATTPQGERTTSNAWSPYDATLRPGGSSSGSATAVAGRLAACATGTQTGGSITNPSAAQGLTGLKPTMGRVSLHGILPLTYTRDHVGPLARDARDAAAMLQAMAGPDAADPRSQGLPAVPDYVAAVEAVDRRGAPGLRWPTRIGVFADYLDEPEQPREPDFPEGGVDAGGGRAAPVGQRADRPPPRRSGRTGTGGGASAHRRATVEARRHMLGAFERLGAEIVEVPYPARWETLTSWPFNDVRLPERSEIFLEHLRRDVRGFGVSLSPWINGLLLPAAEYLRGQRARLILLESLLDDLFSRCDVVVQTAPFPFDMVGLPLLAFPIGFESESVGVPRPVSALLGGRPFGEERLLALVAAYQRVTEWHRRRPPDPDRFERGERGGERSGARSRLDLDDVMAFGQ